VTLPFRSTMSGALVIAFFPSSPAASGVIV
jgi:hypothetical protein